jgi:hypothetical protein
MLRVAFRQIRPDRVDRLRAWMLELEQRAGEVRQTFDNEGVQHEHAFLIESADGPVLVYAVEVADTERAERAYAESTLTIDLEHRRVMADVVAGDASVESLYELRR